MNKFIIDLDRLSEKDKIVISNLINKYNYDVDLFDDYYYITHDGNIKKTFWKERQDDFILYDIGNFFKTEEEAEFALERLKVITEMRDFIKKYDRMELDWSDERQPKHFLYCNGIDNSIHIDYRYNLKYNDLCAFHKEVLEDMVKIIGEDRIKKNIILRWNNYGN